MTKSVERLLEQILFEQIRGQFDQNYPIQPAIAPSSPGKGSNVRFISNWNHPIFCPHAEVANTHQSCGQTRPSRYGENSRTNLRRRIWNARIYKVLSAFFFFSFPIFRNCFRKKRNWTIGGNILIIVSHNGAVIGPIRITGLYRVKTLLFHCEQ